MRIPPYSRCVMNRTTLTALFACLLAMQCNIRDSTDPSSGRSRPKARLENIASVPPATLKPQGPGLERTPRGVATKLIYRGNGKRRATNRDALILYSQTYDAFGAVTARGGELVGDPAVDLSVDGQQAIQMMVEGDVRRFWFPNEKQHGRITVTDFELIWISPDRDEK